MIKVVPYNIEHLKALLDQPMNAHLNGWILNDYAAPRILAEEADCCTGLVDDQVMICAFFIPIWEGRYYFACVLSEEIKHFSVTVYKGFKKILKNLKYRRIEMDVPVDLEIAHKRAKFLGFTLEQPRARKYKSNGEDAALYALVRESDEC